MRYQTMCLLLMTAGALTIGGVAYDAAAVAQSEAPQLAPAPGSETTIPEKIAPPSDAISGPSAGESLSDHLNDTGGVLTPKGDPDPAISVSPPVPDPGTTIVIPPPGAPGGDPTIQPK